MLSNFLGKLDNKYNLLLKGNVAIYLREVHCLIFADLIINKKFDKFSTKEIVGILSCFTNVKVSDSLKSVVPTSKNPEVKQFIKELAKTYESHCNLEVKQKINTGTDYSMNFDLTDYLIQWCECISEPDCKLLLQQLSQEKDIFLGEFVKAVLKIANIAAEMDKVAELLGDMDLLQKLRGVPGLLLKFVATNQSLYV